MGIQLDFGGFDPTFIGATIRLSSRSSWNALEQFRRNPENVPPVSHLSDEERFEALSITSVLSHEVRHFHDFFIAPYHAQIFLRRIRALANVLQTIAHFKRGNANIIFLPITQWCRLNYRDREKVIRQIRPRRLLRPWRSVDLPFIEGDFDIPKSPIELNDIAVDKAQEVLIRIASFQLEKIDDFTSDNHIPIQPWQVLEITGLITQIQDIKNTYGASDADFFIKKIMSLKDNPYATTIRLIAALWRGEDEPFIKIGAMAVWALLGSYKKDQWSACPGYRFERVSRLVAKDGSCNIRSDNDLVNLFNRWSRELNLSTVEEGLAETHELFHHLEKSFSEMLKKTGIKDAIDFIPTFLEGIIKASDHMIFSFKESPLTYTDPVKYIGHYDKFVNPLLRIICEEPYRLQESIEKLENRGFFVHWAERKNNRDYVISMIEPIKVGPHTFIDINDASRMTDYIGICDYLFSEKLRGRQEIIRAAEEFFREWPIRRLELRAYML